MKQNAGEMAKIVAERIKHARIIREYTAEMLAEKCGLSTATVKQIESGKKDCYASTLFIIAETLGVSVDYLLGKELTEDKNFQVALSNLSASQKKLIAGIVDFINLTGNKYVP